MPPLAAGRGALGFGVGVPHYYPFWLPRTLGYDEGITKNEYNPAKVKELLAAAGHPNGISIELKVIAREPENTIGEFAQPPCLGRDLLPLTVGQRRERARVRAPLPDRVVDLRRRGDRHTVGDVQVTRDHGGAADAAAPSNARRPGDSHAPGDRRMRTDHAVVPDLDLVIELHALVEHRVADGAAVGVGCPAI